MYYKPFALLATDLISSNSMPRGGNHHDTFYKVLGRRICLLRGEKRLTQRALADSVGLTRTSLTNIEKGRQKILAHTLVQLADKLSVSLPRLVPPVEKELDAVLDEARISKSDRELIKAALESKK